MYIENVNMTHDCHVDEILRNNFESSTKVTDLNVFKI